MKQGMKRVTVKVMRRLESMARRLGIKIVQETIKRRDGCIEAEIRL